MSWFSSHNNRPRLFLGLFLIGLFLAPQVQAACTSTTVNVGGVPWLISCTELLDSDGGAGTLAFPASVAGDLMILTIVADGSRTTTIPNTGGTWTQIAAFMHTGGAATAGVTVGVWALPLTAASPASIALNVANNGTSQDYIATMMRFTGYSTAGYVIQAQNTVVAQAEAPSLAGAAAESLILRLGGFDGGNFATVDNNGNPIIAGHATVSQDRSSGQADAVSIGIAVTTQPAGGDVAVANFTTIPTANGAGRTLTMALAPVAPQCTGTNTVMSTGPVQYEGCVQTHLYNDATSITLQSPAATAVGDYLLAALTIDGNVTLANITAPAGWTAIDVGGDGTAGTPASTLAIYGRLADTANAQNYSFSWVPAGIQEAFGYIMRFSGASGVVDKAAAASISAAAGTNHSTPAITTQVRNSLVVRIGGFNDNLLTLSPTTIMSGLNNITQSRSGGHPTDSVSSGAAWLNQIAASPPNVAAVNFSAAPTTARASRRMTLALRPLDFCTGTNPNPSNTAVEYAGCSLATGNNVTTITVPTPTGTQEGDYLLAAVVTDGTPAVATPSGWTLLNDSNTATGGSAASMRVYARYAPVGVQPQDYTWTGLTTQDVVAYIMRFTGALGNGPTGFSTMANSAATREIETTSATAATAVASPALSSSVPADTMIVRLAGFDGHFVSTNALNMPPVVTGMNTITVARSTPDSTNSVSSAAAWITQASAGTPGATNFTALSSAGAQRRVTLALRPLVPDFRISLSSSTASTCAPLAPITVTVRADRGHNFTETGYTGTIQLSTSDSTYVGAWGKGDGSGTLTNNFGDGKATYQFALGDGGDVALQFYPEKVNGALNFNVADGSRQENASFDPNLNVTDCSTVPTLPTAAPRQVCVAGAPANNPLTLTIAINGQTPTSKRLLVFVVSRFGNIGTAAPTTTQTFGGAGRNVAPVGSAYIDSGNAPNANLDVFTQMFMMSDTIPELGADDGLPDSAGTYTFSAQNIANDTDAAMRMCAFYFENMVQGVPTGQAVATTNATTAGTSTTTNITNPVANSVVIAGLTGSNQNESFTNTTSLLPLPADVPEIRNHSANGSTSTFTVGSGIRASAGTSFQVNNVSVGNITRRAQVVAAFAPAPPELAYFRITHLGRGSTCAPNYLTITAVDQYGDVFTGHTGQVVLDAGATGNWYPGTGPNAVTPNNGAPNDNNGQGTYQFLGTENGVITVGFFRSGTGDVNFNVRDSVVAALDEHDFFDPLMTLDNCKFRFTHAPTGNICSPTAVTLSAYDALGNPLNSYEGTVNLSTDLTSGATVGTIGGGTWSNNDNFYPVNNTGSGDATIQFHATDGGSVVLNYSRTSVGTIDFNAVQGAHTEDFTADTTLTLSTCRFRISHPGGVNGDVCTPKAVTITAVNNAGTTVGNYAGTVTVKTATGIGTWSHATLGSPRFVNHGGGEAAYTFDGTEGGSVTLSLMHHATSPAVDINVNSGTFQEDTPGIHDLPLNIAGCKFRIALTPASVTACTTATVTLSVYNSLGSPATQFAGQVTLSTDTGNGSWLSETGAGALSVGNETNGIDTYTFVNGPGGDMGAVQLVFTHNANGNVNFDVNSAASNGAIIVDTSDPAYDPSLKVTSCLPIVGPMACFASNNESNAVTLPASAATQGSRVALMYVSNAAATPIATATLGGTQMRLLHTEPEPSGTTVQAFILLDADLPPLGGPVNAVITGFAGSPAMCIVVVTGAQQQDPVMASPATLGPVNGTNLPNATEISTQITTTENNAVVFSVVANAPDGSTYESSQPNELWNGGPADANDSNWAGFYGHQLVAGAVLVENGVNAGTTPTRQAQIVLAINPKVIGPPASTAGYVPVTLFETFSGNLNYRATGNTLRLYDNLSAPCFMQDAADGSTATLNLPAGATVVAAYLYWAGSGFEQHLDKKVRFGVLGDPLRPELEADEEDIFFIDGGLFPDVSSGFFAAVKNVTGYVNANPSTTYHFSDLDVQWGQDPAHAEWYYEESCVGGWSLVVVYRHPSENLNVINLFHGFQPFFHSSFRLVPRNFRMAPPDGISVPNGQITHVTFEGDLDPETHTGINEVFELQNTPTAMTFDKLVNVINPPDNQYNSTVSYPLYTGNVFTGNYFQNQESWGTDVDTYYIQGDTSGELLYPFGFEEAEQITTEYSTGQDMVLLVGEFIMVANGPIADLEVTMSTLNNFKVNTNGTAKYRYVVKNNGNGGATGGFANGDVILTGTLPEGITINSIVAPGWTCTPAMDLKAFTCVLKIVGDWTVARGASVAGQLRDGESLPAVEVALNIDNEDTFTQLNNSVTAVARIAHVGNYASGNCQSQGMLPGVQPNPNPVGGCTRSPQFDNKNDLNKYLININNLNTKSITNNNVHGITRDVRGVETDLQMTKTLSGILQTNTPASYLLSVKNNGPDATTKDVTVTDTLPAGLVPTGASGSGWNCTLPPPLPAVQTVSCVRPYTSPIAAGATAPVITLVTAAITAIEGSPVTNNATVAAGAGNHDTVMGNNTEGDTTAVTGPLVATDDKFLLSATAAAQLGDLSFADGDLVLYDPTTNTAELWLSESAMNAVNLNIDALHLLPNGKILISSANDGASIAGLAFDAEDLVLYDPLLQTATMIFDGSTIFAVASRPLADIDAVHVLMPPTGDYYTPSTWTLLLSVTGQANTTIGATPAFQVNDIVQYVMSSGVATVLVNGATTAMFSNANNGNITSLYRRYDDTDKYILNMSDAANVTIGSAGQSLQLERGEVVEIDLSPPAPPTPRTQGLFCNNVGPPSCVGNPPRAFDPTTAYIDALHVIETGYFGHFAITSAGGDACSATAITITKHAGLGHDKETAYAGSVRISSSLGAGVWSRDTTAVGNIYTTGYGLQAGEAIYVFDPADQGDAILYLTGVTATNTLNVHVTNGIGAENSPTEDGNIVISDLVTAIEYRDQFAAPVYNNNEFGYAAFATNWVEANDDGSPLTGKVRIAEDPIDNNSKLRFNNFGGGQPSITRQVNFAAYIPQEAPVLTFDYRIAGTPTGTFVVEARDGSDINNNWTQLQAFTASSGSGSASYALSLPPHNVPLTAATQIRFRIASGYGGHDGEVFWVDNVQVSTETHDCSAGATPHHYAVTAADSSMVSCLAKDITITPHNLADLVTEPGQGIILTLNTGSGQRGTWGPPHNGSGAFTSNPGFGQATYVYQAGETSLTFPFYYTELLTDPEAVNFVVSDNGAPPRANSPAESVQLSVASTGFRFYNETDANEVFPTLVAGMPSNLYPRDVLTLQAVRTNPVNPGLCEAAFPDNTDVVVQMAAECINPGTCSTGPFPVFITNNNTAPTTVAIQNEDVDSDLVDAGYTDVTLRFNDNNLGAGASSFSRAQLILNRGDAGAIRLHAKREIVEEDEDGDPLPSGDFMTGISDTFVVRPFAFDIDFLSGDRATNGNDDDAVSWATDASKAAFHTAGVGIPTTVRAVAWECIDDDPGANCTAMTGNFDGIPAQGANLFGNATTPAFGEEEDDDTEDDVEITHTPALMSMPDPGLLTDAIFDDFTDGTQSHALMRYSEVGIINLTATTTDYLDGGENVIGTALNVGRFKPANFFVDPAMFTFMPRPLFTTNSGPFTYLGEEFSVGFTLTARNAVGGTTLNYVGDFAKIRTTTNPVSFYAVRDLSTAADVNLTLFPSNSTLCNGANNNQRICQSATSGFDLTPDWTGTLPAANDNGVRSFTGNLILSRQLSEVAEGPYNDIQIGMAVVDSDGVKDALNGSRISLDDSADDAMDFEYNLIATREFRYGRLRLENIYGSEISDPVLDGRDLEARVVAEYFKDGRFIVNGEDNATTYTSDALSFVFDPETALPNTLDLTLGNTLVKGGDLGTLFNGETRGRNVADVPLYFTAPGENADGQLLFQMNLDDPVNGVPSLRFLKYNWRSTGQEEDVVTDGDSDTTVDNPRALIEFGTYRGNDRIINWQEIFE